MNIGWPEGIYLALVVLGIGFAIAKHGQPRDDWSLPAHLFAVVVALGLLYWGGFFA